MSIRAQPGASRVTAPDRSLKPSPQHRVAAPRSGPRLRTTLPKGRCGRASLPECLAPLAPAPPPPPGAAAGGGGAARRMPEGPELHLASQYVNQVCTRLVFGGRVEKSAVSRNPEVSFESSAYHISAASRGKELRLTLCPLPGAQPPQEPLALVFRFGMSGSFQLAPGDALPPHAHLRFYTAPPDPQLALCFVDVRRFGRWDLSGQWQAGRGPCVLREYEQFRENVLRNLTDKAFDRPICEALLDQRFFNGIGNYLRAEILFRLKIPPFEKARTVLEALQQRRLSPELTLSQKVRARLQNPDLLELCHSVPKEVIQLGGKGYGPEDGEEDFAAFRAWLKCYSLPGMSSLRDRHGRTIWFQGDPGPLAPKGGKSRKKKPKAAQLSPEDTVEVQNSSTPNKATLRTRQTRRRLPSQPTTAQETSLQEGPEMPPRLREGKRRGWPTASGRRHKGRKSKADTSPAMELEGALAS
ncbi:endonuclease 8-like 1 isoform X1 [Erinaceus europaeus]|uniref:DNA-(apurinic or apyrimidinic site) lyase n=1 Tax=Erinaceus europaeus TaxID=9365 RepID=A0A1S3WF60_ERIEU|nr:endonuclease 8-like 1 isoform X1 [Erinaceus europaeus]